MSFICERCGDKFSTKQRLKTHMSRKVLCVQKSENIGVDSLSNPTDPDRSGSIRIKSKDEPNNGNHITCKYCGKIFTLSSNCIRHENYRCKHNRPLVLENTIDM